MAKKQTEQVEQTKLRNKGISLNPNAGELIHYLQQFPKDAKVTIWHDYKTWHCQICCNFEHQKKTKTAQLMLGFIDNSNA